MNDKTGIERIPEDYIMNKPEIIILDTSDEAASIKTVTGWVSRTGRFWGDDERMARYDGSTHKTCDCGQIVAQNDYCRPCSDARQLAKFHAMERAPWNGTDYLYSEAADGYFADMAEVEEYCAENDLTLVDMRLVICEPNDAREIDPNEHYTDDLAEDCEVPAAIAAAFEVLNKVIREHGTALSWSPRKYALDLALIDSAEAKAEVI